MTSQVQTRTASSIHQEPTSIDEPLLIIPEAKVKIFKDWIISEDDRFLQLKTSDTENVDNDHEDIKSEEREEKLTIDEREAGKVEDKNEVMGKNLKIMFSNSEYAFNIEEKSSAVEIQNVISHEIILRFHLSSIKTLLTVQNLLRKKMCELGFDTKYRIIKMIGKGATATVHLVERVSDGKLFAAKIISLKSSNDKSYETFVNESKLLRILKHKNIINLESVYIHKKELIQVMEFYKGGTLLDKIRNDGLPDKKQKWKVLADLTNALEYLRQRRIIHRDIKLENILIRENEGVREYVISDFGLACWTGEKHPIFERCGTPGYIAPEVLNTEKGKPILDHRCDIFSLGVIAHVIFLYQPLFPYSGNVKELLKLNKKADFSLTGKIYKELSLSEISFLERSLAKSIENRATAANLLDELRYHLSSFEIATPKKNYKEKSSSKVSINSARNGIEVEIKKPTSLTKRKIDFSNIKIEKSESTESRIVHSARKLFADAWMSLTSSTPKKEKLKIKENSLEKHKKMGEYFE